MHEPGVTKMDEINKHSHPALQTLLCINPPMFEVCEVLLSPTQSHVALVGQRGITVLELPQRWGKKSEFEGGRIQINCK